METKSIQNGSFSNWVVGFNESGELAYCDLSKGELEFLHQEIGESLVDFVHRMVFQPKHKHFDDNDDGNPVSYVLMNYNMIHKVCYCFA